MKKTLLAAALFIAVKLSAYDFTLTWETPSGSTTNDVFTTNETRWADISGFKLYRGTTISNFTLYAELPCTTNICRLTNQPLSMAFYYVTATNHLGESAPSNTNATYPPMPPPFLNTLKGSK